MKSANARHVAGSLNALPGTISAGDSELRKRAGKKHRSDYAVGLGRSVRKKAESRDYIDKIALGKSFEKLLRKCIETLVSCEYSRDAGYRMRQTPYPRGSRFISSSRSRPTLYLVSSNCVIFAAPTFSDVRLFDIVGNKRILKRLQHLSGARPPTFFPSTSLAARQKEPEEETITSSAFIRSSRVYGVSSTAYPSCFAVLIR